MTEPNLNFSNGVENHPTPSSNESSHSQRQMLIEVKAQLDGMILENEKLQQSIKKQKDVICAQATTIVDLQSERNGSAGNGADNKNMEDEIARMKAIELELKLKNAGLELKLEEEKKKHFVMDSQIVQLKNENEENAKKIKDLEEKLLLKENEMKQKEDEATSTFADQQKTIQSLKDELYLSQNNKDNNGQKADVELNESSASNNNKPSKSTAPERRELRTRRNSDEIQPTRRSSRFHKQVNYGLRSDDEEDNLYQPGPSRTVHSNTRSTSKTPPHNQQKNERTLSDDAESSTSDDEGSDYVEYDDENEQEYEEKVEVKPSLSSEFEETNVSRKNVTGKGNERRDSSDTTSSKSSAESVQKSNRKRKAETPSNDPKSKKDKTLPHRTSRSATNRKYKEDSDEEDHRPQTVRRSARARPSVNYSVD